MPRALFWGPPPYGWAYAPAGGGDKKTDNVWSTLMSHYYLLEKKSPGLQATGRVRSSVMVCCASTPVATVIKKYKTNISRTDNYPSRSLVHELPLPHPPPSPSSHSTHTKSRVENMVPHIPPTTITSTTPTTILTRQHIQFGPAECAERLNKETPRRA